MQQVYTNGIIFSGTELLHDHAVLVTEEKVDRIVPLSEVPVSGKIIDLHGNYLAPSFIDLQIYGGNGHLFSADPSMESLRAVSDYCRMGGAPHFLITVSTNDEETIETCISVVRDFMKQEPSGLLGIHLEGPWINPIKRGAHQEAFIRKPVYEDAKKIIDLAAGTVKMITLAPELTDERIIDLLQDSGIVVSAGHSNASYAEATKAFKKIRNATHLFNAMSPFQSREPGMVGAVYDHPSVCCSIVADGIHVDFASVRISKRIMGERLFLITDAVTETATGPYRHHYKENRYVLPDDTLSGSSLTMMKAVSNCVLHAGMELGEALRMASLYPARVIGLDDRFGMITKDRPASFTIFDDRFNVKEVGSGYF